MHQPLPLGRLVATPAAIATLAELGLDYTPLLDRHVAHDWGDVCLEDWQANDHAIANHDRIMSTYRVSLLDVIWIITEWDRSATTILLPDDY